MTSSNQSELPICPRCGWHALMYHGDTCDPRAGAAAASLVEKLTAMGVSATKLGYGAKTVGVVFGDEQMTMIFGVRIDVGGIAHFSHERTYLDALTEQRALELAEHLCDFFAVPSKPSTPHDCTRDIDCDAQFEVERLRAALTDVSNCRRSSDQCHALALAALEGRELTREERESLGVDFGEDE